LYSPRLFAPPVRHHRDKASRSAHLKVKSVLRLPAGGPNFAGGAFSDPGYSSAPSPGGRTSATPGWFCAASRFGGGVHDGPTAVATQLLPAEGVQRVGRGHGSQVRFVTGRFRVECGLRTCLGSELTAVKRHAPGVGLTHTLSNALPPGERPPGGPAGVWTQCWTRIGWIRLD
jgi:hypothetical protein